MRHWFKPNGERASTNMARTHGRYRRGERLRMSVPFGHWKTTTLVAGLRTTGIVAPCVLDGPINGEAFTAWVEQFLVPTLKPGDVVIMDNLSSHKGEKVCELIKAAGAELVFPPRPQRRRKQAFDRAMYKARNLVERFFGKLKQFRRVPTRYDKLLSNFKGFVLIATIVIWLK